MSLFTPQVLKDINDAKIPDLEQFRFLTAAHQQIITACIKANANTLNHKLSAVRLSASDPNGDNPLDLEPRMHLFFVAFLWLSDRASGHRFPEFLDSVQQLSEIRDWNMDAEAKAWFLDLFGKINDRSLKPTPETEGLQSHVITEGNITELSQGVATILKSLSSSAAATPPSASSGPG